MTKTELAVVLRWILEQRDIQRPITQKAARLAKANPDLPDCASYALLQAGRTMLLNDSFQAIESELSKLISQEN